MDIQEFKSHCAMRMSTYIFRLKLMTDSMLIAHVLVCLFDLSS